MKIPLREPFHFESAVKSHGWWMLSPNYWDAEAQVYYRPLHLSNEKNILVSVSYTDKYLIVENETTLSLHEKDWHEIKEQIAWIFRLEEDFDDFYALSQELGELHHLSKGRKGRLLRSPTLFEDVVKVILTTNTRWSQTIAMSHNLVTHLGEPVKTDSQKSWNTFPTPDCILEAGETYLKEHIRVGYRSAYLVDAATKALDHTFDLESFKQSHENSTELKTIKGVGPYAFNTLSMLLGKYDSLPIDSEYRKHVLEKYFGGEIPSKKEFESVYDKWGDYKYLAYWFDQ
ncbi:hypothetical protein GCM10008932_09130 [Alkalibacterium iburiense]|uniref:DNA-(apurinic or apyrimidinic site) lyase n=1 Tax=Alkalibacterium iburiense TaxID=290589 RepID=A0ABP3H3Y4_9LACT